MKIIQHLHYSQKSGTLYVRHAQQHPDELRQVSLKTAVRVSYGLEPVDDGRELPDGITFSTAGYRGHKALSELTEDSFNVDISLPVAQIVKAGPLEVHVLTGRDLTEDDQYELVGNLHEQVRGIREHPFLGLYVYVLTVQGMDDGPNAELLQEIGLEMCRILGDRWTEQAAQMA